MDDIEPRPRLAREQTRALHRIRFEKRRPADRKQLAKAIDALGADDVLLVTRLDRLARSTRDLLNVLDTVGKKGAGLRSIAPTWNETAVAGHAA